MRTFMRGIAILVFCSLFMGLVLVSAQDATTEPTSEATMEATTDATAAPMAEATAEETSTSPELSAQNKGVICDLDLVLSLFVAERYFSFGKLHDTMIATSKDPSSIVDLTTLDKGQFTPLFDNMMAMNSSGLSMSDEQMNSMSGMMSLSDEEMMNQLSSMIDMSSLTMLTSSPTPGEPESCASVRRELSRFYTVLSSQDLMSNGPTTTDTSASGENMSWGVTLSGSNEVPGPGDEDGTGTAAVTVDMANGQVCYDLNVQNLAFPAAAAHIHRGAAGESGPVVVPFDMAPDASGAAASCVKVEADLLSEIAQNPAGFYVNVHTSEFPDGAIRGQISS